MLENLEKYIYSLNHRSTKCSPHAKQASTYFCKLFIGTQPCVFVYVLLYYLVAEIISLQNLKYLLSGPLQ